MRIVTLTQENKTPDFYFPSLSAWGADIQNRGNLLTSPPLPDPSHDRNAWVHYKMGNYAPTNSTPGHMLAVGGQTPTLRNPLSGTAPVWDLPTLFKHVESAGHTWGAFTGTDLYPVKFYQELAGAASRSRIHTSSRPSDEQFLRPMAAQRFLHRTTRWSAQSRRSCRKGCESSPTSRHDRSHLHMRDFTRRSCSDDSRPCSLRVEL